jgi:hypothetical protein
MVYLGIVFAVGGGDGGGEPTTIVRWSGGEPMVGRVIDVNDQGISIRVGEEILPEQISWFDVRGVEGVDVDVSPYRALADGAWRAHARLMRGDVAGAQRIYIQLEDQYLWKTGGQSADVSMGLVACRLDRRERAQAVVPFLSWLVATSGFRGAGESAPADELEADNGWIPRVDAQYRLVPGLPPVFGDGGGLLSDDSLPESELISDRQRVIFGYYQLALDRDIHRTEQAGSVLDALDRVLLGRENRDPGVKFFEEMLNAQAHPDAQHRLAARASLDRRIRSNPDTWIELWARLAIGVSLLAEPETQSNERGVIELIHVIVRLEHIDTNLAILASQIADEYLSKTGRPAWGAQLLHDAEHSWAQEKIGSLTKGQTAHD